MPQPWETLEQHADEVDIYRKSHLLVLSPAAVALLSDHAVLARVQASVIHIKHLKEEVRLFKSRATRPLCSHFDSK